jgi:hypothetical protein
MTAEKNMNIEFAKSLHGHDKNQIYLVIERDEKYVYLVNGITKPLAKPKKKNGRHVQIIRDLPDDVKETLCGALTDLTIKRAIKLYNRRNQE